MNPTLTVLGARSLVGRFLLDRLAARDLAGEAVGRGGEAGDLVLPGNFSWRCLDIDRPGDWHAGRDSIVLSLMPLWRVSALLPRLSAARQVVALGSTSVLVKGDSPDPTEQSLVRDLAEAEAAIAEFGQRTGVACTVLRPTLIYDGYRDANVTAIARFALRFGFFPVCAPASGLRQPVHADDVAAAMVAAIDNPAAHGRTFNLPGGETLTYRVMVRRIFEGLGRPARIPALPLPLLTLGLHCAGRIGGVGYSPALFARMNQDLAFDGAEARTRLDYAARPFRPDFPMLCASLPAR
jgi:nucleoside-diphosphate-sugar epimerase